MTMDSHMRRRTDGQSYIYVIAPANPDAHNLADRCKVGVSDDPTKRLLDMQVASPVTLHVSYSRLTSTRMARAIENAVHSVLRPSRLYSEWFRCSPTEVIYLLDAVQGIPDLLERRIKRPFYGPSDVRSLPPRLRIKRGWMEAE